MSRTTTFSAAIALILSGLCWANLPQASAQTPNNQPDPNNQTPNKQPYPDYLGPHNILNGTWEKVADGLRITLTFGPNQLRMTVTAEKDKKQQHALVYADYSVTRDGIVYGIVSSIEMAEAKEPAPATRMSEPILSTDALFSFRHRMMDDGVLTIKDVRFCDKSSWLSGRFTKLVGPGPGQIGLLGGLDPYFNPYATNPPGGQFPNAPNPQMGGQLGQPFPPQPGQPGLGQGQLGLPGQGGLLPQGQFGLPGQGVGPPQGQPGGGLPGGLPGQREDKPQQLDGQPLPPQPAPPPGVPAAEVPDPSETRALLTIEKLGGRVEREKADGKHVIEVVFRAGNVTDADLKELAALKQLQLLDLRGTQVTDTGLKELAALKQLQMLSLCETQVTDTGLKELAALKQLQDLSLLGTKVTDAGVAELQKALPKLKIHR